MSRRILSVQRDYKSDRTGLLFSWGEQLRHMFQEVLIVGENHIVQGMVVAQEDAGIVLRILEGDAVAEERHLVVAGVVVEPKVIETVASGLSLVSGVTARCCR